LGAPRFARYTGAAGGDEPVALRLDQWNAQMAAAALVDVGTSRWRCVMSTTGSSVPGSRNGFRPRRCFIRSRAVVPREMSSGG